MSRDKGIPRVPRVNIVKKVMMFVDGGYLRRQMEDNLADTPFIDGEKSKFEGNLHNIFWNSSGFFFMSDVYVDLIRIYYYDGESTDPKHHKIREYQDKLKITRDVEVKTYEITKSSKKNGYKQKGIDTLIAIDMLSKAYENHYDVAYLLTGDADLIPVINAVKDDAGKKVFGIYFKSSYSDELLIVYDRVYEILKEDALSILL